MNRKKTEKRKIEWMEVIPIAIIIISSIAVGWWMFNREYAEQKKYQMSMRKAMIQLYQIEQMDKEWKQTQKEFLEKHGK